MSSATTNPPALPSQPPIHGAALPVPSSDELERLTSVPDERHVFKGVDWAFYEKLVDSIPEGANIHVDYDGKDLEIMAPSPIHDVVRKTLARFVELTADELEIPYTGLGQTTWKRLEVVRGLEADDCYYFAPEKRAVADEAIKRWSKDVADYPNPDLAIEVDLSPSKIDRPAIYAALRVAEVWRFDGEQKSIVIDRLGEDGAYHSVEASEFLPVRAEEVGRWVLDEDRRAGSAWGRRLRAWAREEPAPRLGR
jgi:Uma2 family endonuclease